MSRFRRASCFDCGIILLAIFGVGACERQEDSQTATTPVPGAGVAVSREEFCGINGEIRSAGFSVDSKYFLLADAISGFPLLPEARLFIVDVTTHECVPGACISMAGALESEDDENIVLGRLEKSTSEIRERLGLASPQGTRRFAPKEIADGLVTYNLGDRTVNVQMRQDTVGDFGNWKSSLQLELHAGESMHKLDSIDNYREGVQAYRAGDLYVSPDGTSVAIVMEMNYEILGHAPSTYCRYMVETANLH